MHKPIPGSRFILLDGLRGFAAIGIASFHLWLMPKYNGFNSFVDFFFVLSGFVLAPSILSLAKGGKKKFFVSRIIRLYPMLIPVFITLILVQKVPFLSENLTGFPSTEPLAFLGAFLLLQVFWAAIIPVYTPLWSLSAELFANLIATIFGSKQRFFVLVLIGLIIESVGIFINHRYDLGWGVIKYLIAIGRVLVGFYLGIILRKTINSEVTKGSIKNIPIFLIIFAFNFYLIDISNVFIIFSAPICYFLVREIAILEETRIPQFILAFFSYIGRISYGVYVWHTVIGNLSIPAFILKYSPITLTGLTKDLFNVTLTVLIIIIVTEVSIKFVETPIRSFARAHLRVLQEDKK
jgi:peptidoglycan/LPS O-acetylase OafA/YrhL